MEPTGVAPRFRASRWRCLRPEAHRLGAESIRNEEAEANPAIAPPLHHQPLAGTGIDSLFSTHPNTANRIAALEAMAAEPGFAAATPGRSGPWNSRSDDVTIGPQGGPPKGPWG